MKRAEYRPMRLGNHMPRRLREQARRPREVPASFAVPLAEGPCLCAEIDEQDRPCLTCEAQAVVATRGGVA